MASIINIEKSNFLKKNVEIYTDNKLGQYSKFLDNTPIFVTYYSLNQNMSKTDVGTGNIESDLGEKSPNRYNKITSFPLFNVPELKPDIEYDETGYDITMDCNDMVLLPNTVRPTPGDYIIIDVPGSKEVLLRVNNFRYNTIQSNDFYNIDADIKHIGPDIERRMFGRNQVVEEYFTVFDNIGTKDRCFIKNTDLDYINGLAELFLEVREAYIDQYYHERLGVFTFPTQKVDSEGNPLWMCDPYLDKFIMDSRILVNENGSSTIVLAPSTVVPHAFKTTYNQTIYHALIKRSTDLLRRYSYSVPHVSTKRHSAFDIYGMKSMSIDVMCTNKAPARPQEDVPTILPETSYDAQTFPEIYHEDSQAAIAPGDKPNPQLDPNFGVDHPEDIPSVYNISMITDESEPEDVVEDEEIIPEETEEEDLTDEEEVEETPEPEPEIEEETPEPEVELEPEEPEPPIEPEVETPEVEEEGEVVPEVDPETPDPEPEVEEPEVEEELEPEVETPEPEVELEPEEPEVESKPEVKPPPPPKPKPPHRPRPPIPPPPKPRPPAPPVDDFTVNNPWDKHLKKGMHVTRCKSSCCVHNIPVRPADDKDEYFPYMLLHSIKDKLRYFDTDDYYQILIYNFLNNIKDKIEKEYILEYLEDVGDEGFVAIPIILHILNETYEDYFRTTRDLEYLN